LYCAPGSEKRKRKRKRKKLKKEKRKKKKEKRKRDITKKKKREGFFYCPFPFDGGDDSRTNPFEVRGNDENQ
jgi:hypothetical protein